MATKKLLVGFLILISLVLVKAPKNNSAVKSYMDLGPSLRASNYGGGSCVYASLVTVLRWQHKLEMADLLKSNYSGPCSKETLIAACESLKIKYAYTSTGDSGFLEWVNRTNRGAVIFYYADHSVTFAGYTANGCALLIDNNTPGKYDQIPKDQFLRNWKAYGGFALTSVYSPSPPKPTI